MKKTLFTVQDEMDYLFVLLDDFKEELSRVSDHVNALITENENLKTKYLKEVASNKLKEMAREPKKELDLDLVLHVITEEEQAYLDYFKEYYGKELI